MKSVTVLTSWAMTTRGGRSVRAPKVFIDYPGAKLDDITGNPGPVTNPDALVVRMNVDDAVLAQIEADVNYTVLTVE